jgi:putative phosphoesterase
MRIAVISDTHNNWPNFQKALNWIKKENISLVLHCGDIMSQEIINDAKKNFNGEIKFVKGNADWNLELPVSQEVEFNNKKIVFCHFPNDAKKLSQSGKYDMVFYGHTHRPWDEKVGNTHMINPGELAGQFYKPSFAVYDTSSGGLELKILENIA